MPASDPQIGPLPLLEWSALQPRLDPTTAESLGRVVDAIRAAGGRPHLAGGAVRDLLLGLTPGDFDIEVFGLAAAGLENALRRVFPVDTVGRSFAVFKIRGQPIDVGLPRREVKTGQGHRDFAVEGDPEMSLEEAAARRDFTVNALLYAFGEGRFLDPLKRGWADLQAGRLHPCSDRFAEDPLRVLRGMQLAARFRLDPTDEAIALSRTLTPEGLPAERLWEEWRKLLVLGERPSIGLRFLRDAGWLTFFPELEALVGCEQDPEWHPEGDVWTHTLHCLDAFAAQRSSDPDEDFIVGLAVLCHDFGKPATTSADEASGHIRSLGHEEAGVEPTRQFLTRLTRQEKLIEAVLPLVRHHLKPALLYRDQSGPAAIRRLARKVGRIDRLCRVARADYAGRPPLPGTPANHVDWLWQQAGELEVEKARPEPLIKGRHLLQRGWQPGPALGKALDQIFEAQLDGAFSTEAEGLEWLDQQGDGFDPE
ncbi:MAG: CCA tRNA nucleotidyltransferase [Opitutales bacterium]